MHIGANDPLIRVDTDEVLDFMEAMRTQTDRYQIFVYDCAYGLGILTEAGIRYPKTTHVPPLVKVIEDMRNTEFAGVKRQRIGNDDDDFVSRVLICVNLHMEYATLLSVLSPVTLRFVEEASEQYLTLIGLMPPDAELPSEVSPLFQVLKHELPTREELEVVAMQTGEDSDATHDKDPYRKPRKLSDADRKAAHAASGLTRHQAQCVFAMSKNRFDRRLDEKFIWNEKAKIITKDGLIEIKETDSKFENIGGLEGAKTLLTQLCKPNPLQVIDREARAKGVLFVGPPGVGKSLTAYCLGNEVGMSTLVLNPGNLKNKYVGDSEKNVRKLFQIIKRLAPCIVVIDEIGLVMPSGKNKESDVDSNMLGTFLTQMNDMEEQVFWFFTSNDVSQMHEAFFRAERIDFTMLVDLPGPDERARCWQLYINKFFPKTIDGVTNQNQIPIQKPLAQLISNVEKAETPEATNQALDVLVTSLLVDRDSLRKEKIVEIEKKLKTFKDRYFDDTDWTPAEIKAACRLALMCGKTIPETAPLIKHFAHGADGAKKMGALRAWAEENGAIDAQTGKRVVLTEEGEEDLQAPSKLRGRKIRRGNEEG